MRRRPRRPPVRPRAGPALDPTRCRRHAGCSSAAPRLGCSTTIVRDSFVATTRAARGVVAEAAADLSTQIPGGDQVLEQGRRGEPGFAELEIELALDRERDVEPNDVEQLERTHRVTTAL